MTRRQKDDADVAATEQPDAEQPKAKKAKRHQEPLDPAMLKPEAAEHLAKGDDAKQKLEVAATALEILGLEGSAKRMWREAEKAFKAAEREARRIQKAGSKQEREAARKEKKQQKIAKLRKQLDKLMADEAAAEETD